MTSEPRFNPPNWNARMLPLIQMYLDEMPERLQSLGELIGRLAWTEAMDVAHRIKGSAGMYGFPAMGEAATRLESALSRRRANDDAATAADADDALAELHAEFGRARSSIAAAV